MNRLFLGVVIRSERDERSMQARVSQQNKSDTTVARTMAALKRHLSGQSTSNLTFHTF
jgi:hypothetical protein